MPTAGARALLAPATVAVALLAASGWLAEPRVGYLAACALATAAAAVALWRYAPAHGRRPLALAVAALVIGSAIAGRAQVRLERFSRAPDEVGRREAGVQRLRLRRGVDDELAALRNIARRSRTVSTDARTAVRQLDDLLGDSEHRAAIRLHGDTMVAWAGTLHADPSRLTEPSGVVATPFGLTVYVTDDSGSAAT